MTNAATISDWKADREAMRRDVLDKLGSPKERSTDELMSLYAAASDAWDAWSPPADIDPRKGEWSDIFDRECQRAWELMEAVTAELVHRWPDRLSTRHHLLFLLADWYHKCNDNPDLAPAMLKLLMEDKCFRRQTA